jgi:hypothetical protein
LKVLLLGELSGVHQELRDSLKALGHDVTVAHSRLATPEFASDVPLYRPPPGPEGVWQAGRDIFSQIRNARRFTGFDVVQMITQKFFHWKIQRRMMDFVAANNRRLVVVNTTCSADYHDQVQALDYRPCGDCMAFDLKADRCLYDRADERALEQQVFSLADAIVATHFDYSMSMRPTPVTRKVHPIPLPIDTRRHRPSPLPNGHRIRIWYGETRYGFKGGRFIGEALDRLASSDLASQVEIIRTQRQPFGDYLAALDSADVVIDQASSYNAGMNGLYAMARGRVVLTGAEPRALTFMGIDPAACPAINIVPDADRIYETLRRLVIERARLPDIGWRSAAFIEQYHSADVVAAQYDALYRRLLDQAP